LSSDKGRGFHAEFALSACSTSSFRLSSLV
jgi:hypothetical protein